MRRPGSSVPALPRGPAQRAVGPGPPRHRSAVPTRTSSHARCCWKDMEPQGGGGPPVRPGPPCGWRDIGPCSLEAKRKKTDALSTPSSHGRGCTARGGSGVKPPGPGRCGGAEPHTGEARWPCRLHTGTQGCLLPGPLLRLCTPHHQQISVDWHHFQALGSE